MKATPTEKRCLLSFTPPPLFFRSTQNLFTVKKKRLAFKASCCLCSYVLYIYIVSFSLTYLFFCSRSFLANSCARVELLHFPILPSFEDCHHHHLVPVSSKSCDCVHAFEFFYSRYFALFFSVACFSLRCKCGRQAAYKYLSTYFEDFCIYSIASNRTGKTAC